jgi:F-type H+-transporting ATPase subunit epsilon
MAERRKMKLSVVTPERQVISESTDALVVVPAHDGELGVLQGRAPLLYELGVGELRYQVKGQMHRYFIDGGFFQVVDDTITLLTERALTREEITLEVIGAAERDASPSSKRPPAERALAQRRSSVLRAMASRA